MSQKIGHFDLLEQIGKGGMAAVFKAYDSSLNRTVAVKILDEGLAREDPQFVESFIHEAQSAAAINHPNIVQIYSVGEETGRHFIAMELLSGRTLDEIIKNEGPQSEEQVLRIGIQIADALRAAYANQMIHGDIKPQNIFITNTGVAKLLDFGLAKMANIEAAMESDGSVWGSAYYISPERVGHKAEDFRSDIYSLGATLFHALVGHPPFDADTPEELAQKRLSEKAPSLRRINPQISEKTEQIVARMLNKSTFLRYLDYELLERELSEAEAKLGEVAVPEPVPEAAQEQEQPVQITAAELAAQMVAANTASLARLANTGNLAAALEGLPVPSSRKNLLPLVLLCSLAALFLGGGIAYFALRKSPVDSSQPTENSAATPTPGEVNTPAPASNMEASPEPEKHVHKKATPRKTPELASVAPADNISTAAPVAGQLLQNPSFEEAGSTAAKPAGWQLWGNMERTTTWIPTHSGDCLMVYLHRAVSGDSTSGFAQDVPNVIAGQRYKFSIYAMAGKVNAGAFATKTIELWLESTHAGQKVKIESSKIYPIIDLPPDNKWHELSVAGTLPDNNLRVVIEFTPSAETPRGGTIKLDDASLELVK